MTNALVSLIYVLFFFFLNLYQEYLFRETVYLKKKWVVVWVD